MKNRINHQIESQKQLTLTLQVEGRASSVESQNLCRNRHLNRSRRLRRAATWFAHMRHVVDLAPDPVPAAPVPAAGDDHAKAA